MPRPSRLRERVALKSSVMGAGDGAGGYAYSWTTYATVFGRLVNKSGDEKPDAGGLTSETTHIIEIRHRSDVTAAHKATIDGTDYQIRAVLADERKRWLFLHCKQNIAE